MSQDKNPNFSRELKLLVLWLKDALISLRELLVAAIALLIVFAESLLKAFNEWNHSRDEAPSPILPQDSNEVSHQVNEIKREDFQEHKEEIDLTSAKQPVTNFTYTILASVSTLALVVGVARLGPIAQWAGTQNECIESTKRVDSLGDDDLSVKVMICNGGHE